ncbi:MAG TPA: HAMP domain-containing sensor histidine kinase [Chitinophagaceae bacterium]
MKLASRYNRFNLPVMISLFFLSGIASYFLIRRALQNELDLGLTRIQKRITDYTAAHGQIPSIISFDDQKVSFEKTGDAPLTQSFSTTKEFIPEQNKEHISRTLVFPLAAGGQRYKVQITMPLEGTRHMTRVILIITIAGIFLVILVSVLINRYVLLKLWRPFYESLRLVREFKIGQPGAIAFPETGVDEFSFMIDNLKAATANVSEDYNILREFTENASHEIQTPLAIIRSKLDLLIQEDNIPGKQVEALQGAYAAVKKLSLLNQALLLVARIDNRQFENKTSVNLLFLLEEKLQQFQELWQFNRIELSADLQEANIVASPELIDILINNILSNATRHNLPNGVIKISLSGQSLQVINSGPGKPLDKKRLFRRFYKENNQSSNNGLGLSIVKQICEASGITAVYQYSTGQHAFIFTW